MILLPYYRYSIQTTMAKKEIIEIVKKNTYDSQAYITLPMYKDCTYFFCGRVRESAFDIWKNIANKKDVNPIAVGKVIEEDAGTRVDVSMQPPLWVVIMIVIGIGVFIWRCISLMVDMMDGIAIESQAYRILLVIVSLYIGTVMSFDTNAKELEDKLSDIIAEDIYESESAQGYEQIT